MMQGDSNMEQHLYPYAKTFVIKHEEFDLHLDVETTLTQIIFGSLYDLQNTENGRNEK